MNRQPLVRRDTLMAKVDLNHAVGNLQINVLAHETIWHGVLAGLIGHMKV